MNAANAKVRERAFPERGWPSNSPARTRPLMHFSDIDLPDFLIRRADKTALNLVPDWTRHLIPGGGQSGELARTIRIAVD